MKDDKDKENEILCNQIKDLKGNLVTFNGDCENYKTELKKNKKELNDLYSEFEM